MNKKEEEDDDYYDVLNYNNYYILMDFTAVNALLIPQIILILYWTIINQNEFTFLIATPCFLYLFNCLNFAWGNLTCYTKLNYQNSITEMILHFSYLGLLLICLKAQWFLISFALLNCILSLIMIKRYRISVFTQNISFPKQLVYYLLAIIQVFLQCGVELRRSGNKELQYAIKIQSQRTLNALAIIKWVQLIYLLIFLALFQKQTLNSQAQNMQTYFIITILISAFISLVLLFKDLWNYVLLPLVVTKETFIEIESYQELKNYNDLHRSKKLDLSEVEYVNFALNQQTINNFTEEENFEILYGLIFNFGEQTFQIPGFGQRDQDKDYLTIQLHKIIYLSQLEQLFQLKIMNPHIQFISFSFRVNLSYIFGLIKCLNFSDNNVIVQMPSIHPSLLDLQKKKYYFNKLIFCQIIVFQELISGELTNNPKEVLFDLFDQQYK